MKHIIGTERLYQYMTKKYGQIEAPKDIKMLGTPVTDGELFFPDAENTAALTCSFVKRRVSVL